jgi:hypothetical protein
MSLLIQEDDPLDTVPQQTLTFSKHAPSSSCAVAGWVKLLAALILKSNVSSSMLCTESVMGPGTAACQNGNDY